MKHHSSSSSNPNTYSRTRGRKAFAKAAMLSLVGAPMSHSVAQTAKHDTGPATDVSQGPLLSFGPEGDNAQEGAAPQANSGNVHNFNIAPGELANALESFTHTTGVHVHSILPADKLSTFRTQGAQGPLPDQQALGLLLYRTGLDARWEGANRVEIAIRDAQRVDVTASIAQVGLQQFSQPLVDTPQSISTVPQFIMNEQADTTLRDSLRNVPGIAIAAGEGGSQGDTLTIRGFNARNDIFLDGIRDFGSYYRDSFDYDAVDVLEGPAGVEFGRGSTGGVVNQETKMPGLQPHLGGNLQLGTNLMRRLTADVDEPIEPLNGAAFRVNVVGEESNIAGRDFTNVRRFGVAPSLAFGLNSPTRAFFTYLHEGENDLPDYGLPYFGTGPISVPRNTYYGWLEGNYFRTNPDIVTGRVEHDFGLHLTLRNALRWANYPRDVNITEPQVNTVPTYRITGTVAPTAVAGTYQLVSGTVTGTCAIGSSPLTSCYALNTPLSQVAVKRNPIVVKSVEDMLWDQASAIGHARIGHISNDYTVIFEGGRERSDPQRPVYPTSYYTTALAPNASDLMPAASTLGPKTHVNATSYGVGFNDTLKPFSQLELSGGVRFDYFNTDYTNGTTHLSRLDRMPTYRAAAVYKPQPNGSIYFDWGTSFNPSAESLSLSANNAVQAPQTNETYEAGVKWTFLHDRLNLNGSWFQTVKDNVYETDPTNSLNVIPVGDQRVRGVQIGGLGHMRGNFDLIFGYAYLNGITIGSIANYSPLASVSAYVNGSAIAQTVRLYIPGDPIYGKLPFITNAAGNPFANVPKNSANLFVTHHLGWGFIGGFGFNQVSARRASSTGPVAVPLTNAPLPVTQLPLVFKSMPGYWNFNAMLRRPISDRIAFQANVNNLTNAFFIDQPHPNHLIPSEGINAQFGMNYTF